MNILIHIIICVVIILGILFSKTRISQGAVLAILLLLFIGIRMLGTCIIDFTEVCEDKQTLADFAAALTIKDHINTKNYDFEQAVVGSLLIVHLIKIYVLSIYPVDILF
jgi:hypothetical protein